MAEEQSAIQQRVLREHLEDPQSGLRGARLRIHAAIHTAVEVQLAEGRPPQTQATLQRLMDQGMTRHEAIHAIGAVVADELHQLIGDGRGYDEVRFVRRLAELTADPPPADPPER